MGVTQHSHGTEHVLAVERPRLMTGNLGRPGTGVNPLRGQNNVQGACDAALPGLPGLQAVADELRRVRRGVAAGCLAAGLTVTEVFDATGRGRGGAVAA